MRGSGERALEGGWKLLWSGAPEEDGAAGWRPCVGLLLNPAAAAALSDWQPISSRLLRADFKGSEATLTVLIFHAPTSEHPQQQQQFEDELAAAEAEVPGRDMLVALGDANARPGSRANGSKDAYTACLGPHGVGQRNDAGERLLQLCAARGLCVANSYFCHKPAQQYTWISADGRTKAAIDVALVRRQRLSTV